MQTVIDGFDAMGLRLRLDSNSSRVRTWVCACPSYSRWSTARYARSVGYESPSHWSSPSTTRQMPSRSPTKTITRRCVHDPDEEARRTVDCIEQLLSVV